MRKSVLYSLLILSLSMLNVPAQSQNRFGRILQKITFRENATQTIVQVKQYGKDSLDLIVPGSKSRIGRIHRMHFAAFTREAGDKGLTKYDVVSGPTGKLREETGMLYFNRKLTFKAGSHSIVYQPDFFRSAMVLFRQDRTVNRSRHVVFFHDPHGARGKLSNALDALHQLMKDNPGIPFKFLVEGYFEEETSTIPIGPIASILSDNISKTYQVNQLLRNFLIDVPLGYRLLNNNVSAEAIDDPVLIRCEAPWEQLNIDTSLVPMILQGRDVFVKDFLFPRINRKIQADNSLRNKYRIDSLATVYSVTQDELKSNVLMGLALHCQRTNRDCFSKEIGILNSLTIGDPGDAYASGRDFIMAENINRFLANAGDTVAVIFIGSFHDKYLLQTLPENVSYSIIDPNGSNYYGDERFTKMLLIDIADYRRDAINKLGSYQMKLPVAPLQRELPAYREFIAKLEQKYNVALRSTAAGDPDPELKQKIIDAIDGNNSFKRSYSYAGYASDLPYGAPPGAFCSIHLDSKEVVVYDEDGWLRNPHRVIYLQNVVCPSNNIPKVSFCNYRNEDGAYKPFHYHYNKNTQTIYLIEPKDAKSIEDSWDCPGDQRWHTYLFEFKFKNIKTPSNV